MAAIAPFPPWRRACCHREACLIAALLILCALVGLRRLINYSFFRRSNSFDYTGFASWDSARRVWIGMACRPCRGRRGVQPNVRTTVRKGRPCGGYQQGLATLSLCNGFTGTVRQTVNIERNHLFRSVAAYSVSWLRPRAVSSLPGRRVLPNITICAYGVGADGFASALTECVLLPEVWPYLKPAR